MRAAGPWATRSQAGGRCKKGQHAVIAGRLVARVRSCRDSARDRGPSCFPRLRRGLFLSR